MIPEFLKKKINLKNSGAVIGVGDRGEIWEEGAWKEYIRNAEKESGAIAEKLGNRDTGTK